MSKRDELCSEHSRGIQSDQFAIGRTRETKLMDGIMASVSFCAGFDAAIEEVRKIADEIQEYLEPECDDGLQGGQAYISAKALHEFLDSLSAEQKGDSLTERKEEK